MLKLRRAIVVDARSARAGEAELGTGPELGARSTTSAEPAHTAEQRLLVELSATPGVRRPAIADVALVGRCEVGDELIVNVEALDLELGSGGFDVVHVNLTRGLSATSAPGAHVMKLNYTSLQHTVAPVEEGSARGDAGAGRGPGAPEDGQGAQGGAQGAAGALGLPLERPVGVLALHGQLAAVAWAFAAAAPGRSLGYVQTDGGSLPGGRSRTVRELRERGLLAGHLTAGAAFGGEGEAITTAGALHHGLRTLGWDAVVCGPGPGIVGSASTLGHGGMAALDSAHAALALGAPTLIVARMSSGDARERHRGISHHTLTVLDLLLEPVSVALPAGMRSPVGVDLRAGLGAVFGDGDGEGSNRPALALDVERPVRITRHDWRRATVDLPGYAASGLPATTMGRTLAQDPLFFGAALAAGRALAELAARARGNGHSASGAAA